MSRKDYVAAAAAIKAVGSSGGDEGTLIALVIRLSEVFAADNDRFSFSRFVNACGLSSALVLGDEGEVV